MKLKKKGIVPAIVNAGIGVAGGIVANLLDSEVMPSQSNEMKAAIKAGAGALIPALISNNYVEKLCDSMVAVAGYQLASTIGIGAEVNLGSNTAVSGTPDAAVAMDSRTWIESKTMSSKPAAKKVNSVKTVTLD